MSLTFGSFRLEVHMSPLHPFLSITRFLSVLEKFVEKELLGKEERVTLGMHYLIWTQIQMLSVDLYLRGGIHPILI